MQPKGKQTVANENKTETVKAEAKPDAPREWNVMVRHTAFLKKNLTVMASSKEEAKAKFLDIVKAEHERRAVQQDENSGLDNSTRAEAKKRIRDAFVQGMEQERQGVAEWTIRPAAEARAAKERIYERRQKLWGEPVEDMLAGAGR